MTMRYAKIPKIEGGVVFSDPSYDESVWCQYRKDFNASNWLMKLQTREEDGCLNFDLYLGRPTVVGTVRTEECEDGINVFCPGRFDIQSVELGIDTAKIFCGQRSQWDKWSEEGSVYTAADGLFGQLQVFTCRGEDTPAGFLVLGSVDTGIVQEEDLFATLVSSFCGERINEKLFQEEVNPICLNYRMVVSEEMRHFTEFNKQQEPDSSKHLDGQENER